MFHKIRVKSLPDDVMETGQPHGMIKAGDNI